MKKRTRLKRWCLWIAVGVGAVTLLLVVIFTAQSLVATRKLNAVEAQLERDSIPLSWAELQQQFPDVEQHLAAQPDLLAALDGLTNLPSLSDKQRDLLPIEGSANLPGPGVNLPTALITAMEERLRAAEPVLAGVRAAVAKEPFWLVPPTGAFNSPTLSRLTRVRQAARLLTMSAILHAERNAPAAATQAVLDGIALAEVLHRGSLLIDELVRFSCEGSAVRSLEYVLAGTDPTHNRLRELEAGMSNHSDMRSGLLGEIVYTKQIYAGMSTISKTEMRTLYDLTDSGPWQRLVARLPVYTGWIRMNEAYHLDLLHHAAATWDFQWKHFTNEYAQAADSIPWPYILPRMTKDAYMGVKERELSAAGAWRCARIAIAIERFTRENGTLPNTLAALAPGFMETVPVEPFDGRPFTYTVDRDCGTLAFSAPNSDTDFTFTVYASRPDKRGGTRETKSQRDRR